MFNLSDVAVVGKFADYKALGAVGSQLFSFGYSFGFLIGMGSGVNVQVALGGEPGIKEMWNRPSILP